MTIQHVDTQYGREARHRLAEAGDAGVEGARAAVETFYFALNQRDDEALADVWLRDPFVQLNNPVGGMLRGGDAIIELYRNIFHGSVRLSVSLGDIVEYVGQGHAVFAGRETGSYVTADGTEVPVTFRTTRIFEYLDGRWYQVHHHGSMDDPQSLADYQAALA